MDGGDDWCLKKEEFTQPCGSQKQRRGVAQCRYPFVREQSLSFRGRIGPSAQSDASLSTNAFQGSIQVLKAGRRGQSEFENLGFSMTCRAYPRLFAPKPTDSPNVSIKHSGIFP